MQFRTPEPGDNFIRAEDIRAIAEEVSRLGKFSLNDPEWEVESGRGGVHVSRHPRPAFWARLTSEYGGGSYAWVEVERSGIDMFTDLQYGRSDDGLSPAYEANRATGLPTDASSGTGLHVWLELGFGEPVTGGVRQEWIFRQGGGGSAGFWARIESANCSQGSYRIIEVIPRAGGAWEDKQGGIDSSVAYHAQKGTGPFGSGGPLVAVGTRVWAWKGYFDGTTQEYVFDCPAGFTGTETVMTDWQCSSGVGTKTIKYREMWNGQQTRGMTLEPPTGSVCS